jgi:drug/metabolite transporter (DMT)-like permease
MTNKTKGIILVLGSALMFGSYGIWPRLIGDAHGIFYPGWTRSLLISLVLLPILLYKKQIVPIERKDWKWMFIFLLVTTMTQAPLFYAFNHMDVGTATLLFFVTMLMTIYAVGFLFLGEKASRVKIISFFLAAIGLYVTFSFSIVAFSILAGLMAVANGVASGSEVAFSKKLSGSYSSLYLIWLSWVVIAITNAGISIAAGEIQYLPSFNTFWMYQCIYAVAGVLGFWLVIEGFKYVEASIGGLLGLLEIIFSITFGFLVFHQIIGPKVILGGLLIICAAALPHIVDLFKKQ